MILPGGLAQPWLWPGFTKVQLPLWQWVRCWAFGFLGKADPPPLPAEDLFSWTLPGLQGHSCFRCLLGLELVFAGLHRLPHSPTPALSSVWFAGSADPSLTWRHGQPCSVPPCLSPSPLRARASGACALGLSVCVLCQNRRQQAFPTKGQRVNILGFPLQIDRDRLGRRIDGWMNGWRWIDIDRERERKRSYIDRYRYIEKEWNDYGKISNKSQGTLKNVFDHFSF